MSSQDIPRGSTADAVDAFLEAVVNHKIGRARAVFRAEPRIAETSLHVASVLGLDTEVRRLIAEDPAQVHARVGAVSADPLLLLCYSPYHGESPERDEGLAAAAAALLAAGADPNTRDDRYGVPALYALTGVNNAPRIARMLLEAGANATDGESLFHAAENFHEEALELLLSHGADVNESGDWGNTPLYFLLRNRDVADHPRVKHGLVWLLDHGAEPNVRCAAEQETSLHVAARRGQDPEVVRLLLERGADLHARRGDGRTAWSLARRGGFDAIATLLEQFGAKPESMSPIDELIAACGRGDAAAARALATPDLIASLNQEDTRLLPEAAAARRTSVVKACLDAGFPVDSSDESGATALHHAAIQGNAELVRELLRRGADFTIRDREHAAAPLGWAGFGADHVADPRGNYEDAVRALLEAGARPSSDDHAPAHTGVREVLRPYTLLQDRDPL